MIKCEQKQERNKILFKLDAKNLVAFGDEFADIVIGTNDADGIAEWLEKECVQ